ncbi:MAG: hypothetical protein EOP88_21725 [Verrucomicrobiaceae bacterium]|nr:MAG: hypothetical protein EOP88_21725 [Verrucomicrobiaceae bacterium]
MRQFITSFLTLAAFAACPLAQAETGPFLNGVFPKTAPGQSGKWALEDAFPHLTFVDPVRLAADPKDAAKAFVICRNGQIWHIPFSTEAKPADKVLVLDLSANTLGSGDSGMMSMVFHPEFGGADSPNRDYVYVYYQWVPEQPGDFDPATPNYLRLSRFTIPDGTATIDPASEFVMIQQFDRHAWHTGGGMFFGQDRFLYLAIGDEGGSKDFYKSGQKINDRLFGGILRIDVDQDPQRSHPVRRKPKDLPVPAGWPGTITQGYSIPNDNPWLDRKGGVLEEFWSIGTRNPHSMCLDDETGEIFVADVGQDSREEITMARRGGNHQWPYKEGSLDGPLKKPSKLIGKEVPPVFDYARAMGGCVIGGMVYRGSAHAGTLTGRYIFGDHASRGIHALDHSDGKAVEAEFLTSVPRSPGDKRRLSGISEGPDGEPYFIELGDPGTDTGSIHRLIRSGPPVEEPPRLLSQTGAFTDTANLIPSPALLPYTVNSPLWTDGAVKQRWISVPSDAAKILYREQGEWDFPVGTVLVKHFALPVDDRNPAKVKPVETRFFIHGEGGLYYGVTYRWNEAGTDAELISKRGTRRFQITGKNGKTRSQTWTFPSRSDCFTCHTPEAGHALSFNTLQLNRPGSIGAHGGNFISALSLAGYLHGFTGNTEDLPRHLRPDETNYSMEARVRSYLDVNCSYCHQAGGTGGGTWDGRSLLTLAQTGLVNGPPLDEPVQAGDLLVTPGAADHSIIYNRMAAANGYSRMPPVATTEVDLEGAQLVAEWINSEVSPHTTYAQWRLSKFGSPTSPEGSPDHDADGDGISNRLEYLTHTNPQDPSSHWKPVFAIENGKAVYQFTGLSDRSVRAYHSTDLQGWSPWNVPGNDGIPVPEGTTTTLEAPVGEGREFFRFEVKER